jgi:hypothetical protein
MSLRALAILISSCTLAISSIARADGGTERQPGEVIVIHGKRQRPAVPPKPKNYSPIKAPPYSDRAIESDAWTRAWLLLDIDETGAVKRFKFIKHPGYDLDGIAASEAFKLRFEPARNGSGRPVKTWLIWLIEWPSYWWLVGTVGVTTRMPPLVYYGGRVRSSANSVPCAGSGPLYFGSFYRAYRDCSKPDLSRNFEAEPWVIPKR